MNAIEAKFNKFYQLILESLQNSFDIRHFYFVFAITISLLVIEIFYAGWKESSLRKILEFNKSTRTDLIAWLIETVNIFSFLSLIFSFGVFYYLVGFIQNAFDVTFEISNPYIQLVVIFVVSDLKGWFGHYIFHYSKSLWILHSFHHSATNFNILTRQRGHFLEAEIKRFFDVIPFVLFGAPIATYLLVKVVVEAHQMLLHSSSNSDWGFVGKFILVSPACHRIHHSIEPKHFNKNFGITFIFWDKLFKTYHGKEEHVELGIPENPYNKGYFKDTITCQWLFVKSLFSGVRNSISPKEKN